MTHRETREALVEQHLDYARKIARGIAAKLPPQVEFEDIEAWGRLGLVQAAERWSPEGGAAFTTFAWYRIRGAIFDGLSDMTGLSARDLRKIRTVAMADAYTEEALRGTGTSADAAALAESLIDTVAGLSLVHLTGRIDPVSLDDQEVATEERTDEIACDRELEAMLVSALAGLSPEDRELVEALYFRGETTTAHAARLGVNKSTVARRHARVIDALRALLPAAGREAEEDTRADEIAVPTPRRA